MNNKISESNDLNNNEELNDSRNDNDISTKSLTVDYNSLYKLESDEMNSEKKAIDQNDIQFDNADYIQDQDIIKHKEREQTKHNLIFMLIVLGILVTIVLVVFPFLFKLKI